MTIRAKLLIVIPLLVLAANTTIFFLFRSSTLVQDGYDQMLNRMLAYKQSVQTSDQSLQALYDYLLDPGPALQSEMTRLNGMLRLGGDSIRQLGQLPALAPKATGYLNMIDTLADQEQYAAEASDTPKEALARYESAEKTAGFIREEGQRLVDLELGADQPIFRQIQQENERMNRFGLAVILVQTLLCVCTAVWLSRSVTGPVGRLVRMARHVSEGRPQEQLPAPSVPSRDELGILTTAFLQMIASLHEAADRDKEQLERERFVKELELRALQSQIQPHFLFNALNVLSKLALLEGAERTSDLIVSMSKLIRYRLRKLDEPVSLRDELGHVAEYAAIQQARFGGRIRFETEIDEQALSAKLPALTVQPLVENAFVHGIESIEAGAVIRLAVTVDGSEAVIEVADNGVGMDEATRRSLLQLNYEPHEPNSDSEQDSDADEDAALPQGTKRPEPASMSAGLGTRNVFRRLQLFTGRGDAVEIRSAPAQGTTFTIRIPMTPKEEAADVPFNDRG
ncbi:sensor histidine kinase [Paenibacillus rhizovicinus]|uniref:histidine kinase n=1 Tax=Paenibacillus rhizovicinus TaxID=2704463 RepID=A0A6C0P444_9BACL|nr:sensor histidine kinase [Paenibacillus rhizovicinus]QHW31442.1 sensor histidine kinase [Paenibacillus rhizovicinus]